MASVIGAEDKVYTDRYGFVPHKAESRLAKVAELVNGKAKSIITPNGYQYTLVEDTRDDACRPVSSCGKREKISTQRMLRQEFTH